MGSSVMIVEDREAIASVMIEMLGISGYKVVATATNGIDALEMYRTHHPDIVLLDLVLPDISGLEVAKGILDMDGSARIVVVTALTGEGMLKDCLEAGCRGFLVKPYRMAELLKAIEKALTD
ncbi:MAG: response regulator [Candidatus Thermoplasmatota archaeon]|nr:response regulator [Candidatus Thermoplasmatota archaeon]